MLHSNRNVQETYLFPNLKPQAIVSCMSDVQVACTEDDLARPTAQKMLVVYEAFMDVATGSPKDDVYLDDIQEMKIVSHPVCPLETIAFISCRLRIAFLIGCSPPRAKKKLTTILRVCFFTSQRTL